MHSSLRELPQNPSPLRITEKQKRVAKLVSAGCTNEEIAEALDISVNTVKVHVAAIKRRLQVKNRVAIATVMLQLPASS